MFIAEDVDYSNLTWIWVDNAKDSNFIILIVWLGHKGLEYGVALQWFHFLERLQGENVETTSRRYNQDCAHDFEEDDLFIEAEAGEDLGVVLMDNGHLLGRKVSCFLDKLTAHDEQNLAVDLHELNLLVIELADLLDLPWGGVAIGMRSQARQEHSLVRTRQLQIVYYVRQKHIFYLLVKSRYRSG